jgi:hypothetical protein
VRSAGALREAEGKSLPNLEPLANQRRLCNATGELAARSSQNAGQAVEVEAKVS